MTGVLLAFEPQITEWLERDRRIVVPPTGAARLPVETLLTRAGEARPALRPSIVTLRADPTAALVVSFGRDGGALFIDPYRGTVLGSFSRLHDLLHEVVEWHRWLGSREIGRPVTGAANLGCLGLVVLGICLWWPRRWTRGAIRPVTLFDSRLHGRARDFNWHSVIGIWCAPVLLVLTLTGVVRSYQSTARSCSSSRSRSDGIPPPVPARARPDHRRDRALRAVHRQEPGGAPESLGAPPPHGRGRRTRGQSLALAASAGAAVLAWTGFAQARRRFRGWRHRVNAPGALPTPPRPAKKCQLTDTGRHSGPGSSASRPFASAG